MKNIYIELLRLFLIFHVVLYHYTNRVCDLYSVDYPIKISNGAVPVYIFFIISGFFFAKYLTNDLNKRKSIRQVTDLICSKYYRLFPAYITSVVIIYVFISVFGLPQREMPLTVLLFNFFIWHPGIPFIDGAHWFISDLLILYIICSIFLFFKNRVRVIIICYILYVFFAVFTFIIDNQELNIIYRLIKIESFIPFCTGIIIYLLSNHVVNKYLIILPILSCLIYSFHLKSILLIIYFVLFLLVLDNKRQCCTKYSKLNYFFLKITSISFYWYLIHQNIGYSVILNMHRYLKSESIIVIPIVLTLLLAYVVSFIIKIFPSYFSLKSNIVRYLKNSYIGTWL